MPAAESPHAILHLGRHAILPKPRSRVTQPDGLTLHDEAPQCIARVLHKRGASCLIVRKRSAVMGCKRRERDFQGSAEPPKRGRLLLRDFVVERCNLRRP